MGPSVDYGSGMNSSTGSPRRSPRRPWFRRRSFLVDGFQARFIVTQLAWLAILLGLLAIATFAPSVRSLLGSEHGDLAVATHFLTMHGTIWPLLAAFFVAAAAVSMFQTHRVAGPLYRFRRVFADVGRGVLTMRVTLREGDYLTQEAAELEQMIVQLRTRAAAAQAAVARARESLAAANADRHDDALAVALAATAEAVDSLDTFVTVLGEPAVAIQSSRPRPEVGGETPSAAPHGNAGFTLIELLIVCAIIAAVAAIAIPSYASALETARVTKAIGDITAIDRELRMHLVEHGCYPSTLDEVGVGLEDMRDPWGHPYVYGALGKVPGGGGGGGGGGRGGGGRGGGGGGAAACTSCQGICLKAGDVRKDRNLVPINSDFDLYSVGRDGESVGALTAKKSHDDVIRANDGSFVGLAVRF